eukprot:TRINITY_DN364_c0_g1_i2.p1 TRINITY_DN364_c0_g1~~TRINITY_DN364_c0_g1_i2.p1  ORF type:complete len:360 (-),score=86.30 TRINITY_DN364_c0_g1_i2:71-1150(-)
MMTSSIRAICLVAMPVFAWSEASQVNAHAMIQTSSKSRTRSHASAKTEKLYNRVEALVSESLASKRPLEESERSAINTMKDMITNTMLPGIHSGHKDDLAFIAAAKGALSTCDANLDSEMVTVNNKKAEVDMESQKHRQCRGSEATLETSKEQKNKSLIDFTTSVRDGGNSTPPSVPDNDDDLSEYFRTLKLWAETKEVEYSEKSSAFTTSVEMHDEKQKNCSGQQSTFEIEYCSWYSMAGGAVDTHETCVAMGGEAFDKTKAAVLDNVKQRKAEYASIKQIECLLDLLAAEDVTHSGIEACKKDIDTSFLDITDLEKPKTKKPSRDHLKTKPGDGKWKTDAYANLAAPANEVVACQAA